MMLLKPLMLRFLRGNWGKLLPMVLKAAAEGDLGSQVKWIYWRSAGYKTVSGSILIFIGGGLEVLGGAHPEFVWAPTWARILYYIGGILASVGLVDGGTRAPWPAGTPKDLPAQTIEAPKA